MRQSFILVYFLVRYADATTYTYLLFIKTQKSTFCPGSQKCSQILKVTNKQDLETSKQNAWHTCSLLVCCFLTPVPYFQFLRFLKILYLHWREDGAEGWVGAGERSQRDGYHGKHVSFEEKIYHQILCRSLYPAYQ